MPTTLRNATNALSSLCDTLWSHVILEASRITCDHRVSQSDDKAFVAFLNVVGKSLRAAGKVFGVFLYPSMNKAKYINGLASVDHWLGVDWESE